MSLELLCVTERFVVSNNRTETDWSKEVMLPLYFNMYALTHGGGQNKQFRTIQSPLTYHHMTVIALGKALPTAQYFRQPHYITDK